MTIEREIRVSTRDIAKTRNISHTKLYDTRNLMDIARARGLYEEFHSRVIAGEKQSAILLDLMPDVLEERKVKQQINQYRSTTQWLLKNGFDADNLIQFIRRRQ
jgi:hypothetical protein